MCSLNYNYIASPLGETLAVGYELFAVGQSKSKAKPKTKLQNLKEQRKISYERIWFS